MWFVWMSIGAMVGVLVMCMVQYNKGEDCLNCDVIIARDQTIAAQEKDIRKLTRSLDNLHDRCDQQEVMIHSLRTKMGMRGAELQRVAFLHQKEA
jgi:hypothetical protein